MFVLFYTFIFTVFNDRSTIQLMVFKETNKQLLDEFASLSQQLTASQDCYAQLEHELCSLKGEPSALEAATYEECEEIEAKLKASLQRVEAKKVV